MDFVGQHHPECRLVAERTGGITTDPYRVTETGRSLLYRIADPQLRPELRDLLGKLTTTTLTGGKPQTQRTSQPTFEVVVEMRKGERDTFADDHRDEPPDTRR